MMRRIFAALLAMLLVGGALTGCGKSSETIASAPAAEQVTSEPDPETEAATDPETEAETEAATESATETETDAPAEPETAEAQVQTESAAQNEAAVWRQAYRDYLLAAESGSEHTDAYFSLIRLDADEVPELVLFEDVYVSLLRCTPQGDVVQLMEDAYKGTAAWDGNLSYQPEKSLVASRFVTMGGGLGYTVYYFADPAEEGGSDDELFFNSLSHDGEEVPYDEVWESAEAYGIVYGGPRDVTLTDDWTAVQGDSEFTYELTAEQIEAVLGV